MRFDGKGVISKSAAFEFRTPSHLPALLGNSTEVAQIINDGGADPNKADGAGETPLRLAAMQSHKDMTQIHNDSGAESNKDKS